MSVYISQPSGNFVTEAELQADLARYSTSAYVNSVIGPIQTELSTATPSATPSTLVERDSSAGASFQTLALDGSTSGTLSLTPAAVTTDHTLVMPNAQGAANTYLQNDGSGALSWASAGAAGFAIQGTHNVIVDTTAASISTAHDNLCLGYGTGAALTTGYDNLLLGRSAGGHITSGDSNFCMGALAGDNLQEAEFNCAIGIGAMGGNSGSADATCISNVALGYQALNFAGAGTSHCVAIGLNAMLGYNGTPQCSSVIAIGQSSLNGLVSGDRSIFIGTDSGSGISISNSTVCIGSGATLSDSCTNCVVLGDSSTVQGAMTGSIVLGANATTSTSHACQIGDASLAQITANSTCDLGTAAIPFNNVYNKSLVLNGSSSGAVTIEPASASGTYTLQLPAGGATAGNSLNASAGPGTLQWSTPSVPFAVYQPGGSADSASNRFTDFGLLCTYLYNQNNAGACVIYVDTQFDYQVPAGAYNLPPDVTFIGVQGPSATSLVFNGNAQIAFPYGCLRFKVSGILMGTDGTSTQPNIVLGPVASSGSQVTTVVFDQDSGIETGSGSSHPLLMAGGNCNIYLRDGAYWTGDGGSVAFDLSGAYTIQFELNDTCTLQAGTFNALSSYLTNVFVTMGPNASIDPTTPAAIRANSGYSGLQATSLNLVGATSGNIFVSPPATGASYNLVLPNAQGGSNTFLKNNGSGTLTWATEAVTSVSNSNSTLTISPTTGAVVASLNLAHANTWTGVQAIPGDTSGSAAASGYVGQIVNTVVLFASAVTVSGTTDVTSVTLPAGDWDISGNIYFHTTAGALLTLGAWITPASASAPDKSFQCGMTFAAGAGTDAGFTVPTQGSTSSGSQTWYLSCVGTSSAGTVKACGTIFARRVR